MSSVKRSETGSGAASDQDSKDVTYDREVGGIESLEKERFRGDVEMRLQVPPGPLARSAYLWCRILHKAINTTPRTCTLNHTYGITSGETIHCATCPVHLYDYLLDHLQPSCMISWCASSHLRLIFVTYPTHSQNHFSTNPKPLTTSPSPSPSQPSPPLSQAGPH